MKNTKNIRIFGYIWSGIFLLIALFPLKSGGIIKEWALVISSIFFVTSLIYPKLYQITYIYQIWIKFGDIIGKINSKIIILILFYFVFLPIRTLLKLFRKDLLGKKLDKDAKSYFIQRKDQPSNMKNQF